MGGILRDLYRKRKKPFEFKEKNTITCGRKLDSVWFVSFQGRIFTEFWKSLQLRQFMLRICGCKFTKDFWRNDRQKYCFFLKVHFDFILEIFRVLICASWEIFCETRIVKKPCKRLISELIKNIELFRRNFGIAYIFL